MTVDADFRVTTSVPETRPLGPQTFAGQVESAIRQKFGEEPTKRVLHSWRLLEMGCEHREFISSAAINSDPLESFCYQHAPSYVPGLTCRTFWDINDFDWGKKLANNYKTIRDEFLSVTSDMERLRQEGNNIWEGALTEEAGGYGEGWKTLVLMDRGMWDSVNCNLFPKTAKCVHDSGIPATEVFFASMQPRTSIKMHSDFTNFVLTSHLAIDIPESGHNKCRLSVGDDTRQWINGEVMLFDTSLMHDAVNETDATRYILMFRLWHPELTQTERDALQFIYDCLQVPDLLSESSGTRFMAEENVRLLRTFPETKPEKSGFGGRNQAKKGTKSKRKK